MNILDTIKAYKLKETAKRKISFPVGLLEDSPYFETPCISLKHHVADKNMNGIMAEFKRQSPSKGIINPNADAASITMGYIAAGASALSVLTDEKFFGAHQADFATARKSNMCPILRKDFILDEYQVIEAKSMGADAILLIASFISFEEIKKLISVAHQLGLEVFLETHTENEIRTHAETTADIIGINNRNLNTFSVDIQNSIRLAALLPNSIIKVAESGIESAAVVKELNRNGFDGFLIGEYFMRDKNPAGKCAELIKTICHEN